MATYQRKDGGTVDTSYRGQDVHVAGDGTIFAKPKRPPGAAGAAEVPAPRRPKSPGGIRRSRQK